MAETISQYMIKGSQIALVGNIRTGSYDAQDGTKRYTTDVNVESFEFIGSKGGNNNSSGSYSNNNNVGGFDEITPVDSGDMPF